MAHIMQRCDFCELPAVYDAKSIYGPWAFMCERHFKLAGVKTPGLHHRLEVVPEVSRKCSRCNEDKPISEFYEYVDKRGVPRYRSECKACNLQDRKRQRMKGVCK